MVSQGLCVQTRTGHVELSSPLYSWSAVTGRAEPHPFDVLQTARDVPVGVSQVPSGYN